jgi:hypothetical protein
VKSIKFNVYGRLVTVEKTENGWAVYYPGADGKRRAASDIFLPSFISEAGIEGYLADICHEWATADHPDVKRLDAGSGPA